MYICTYPIYNIYIYIIYIKLYYIIIHRAAEVYRSIMVHLLRNTLTKSQHVKHEQHAESAPKRTYWNGPMI